MWLYMCSLSGFCVTYFNIRFMQVRASDSSAYFSCDDHFPVVKKANGNDEGVGNFQDQSLDITHDNIRNISHKAISSEGNCYIILLRLPLLDMFI